MARTSPFDGRQSEPSSGPTLIPIAIAAILIIGAVAVALLTKKPKEAIEAGSPKAEPFAEMPPETPPPREQKPKVELSMAPESIATEPLWLKAQVVAAEAKLLYDACVSARAKGDRALARENGEAARKKYSEAVETTAEWEESVLSRFNESDSKIRAIKAARTDWFNKLRFLEKDVER